MEDKREKTIGQKAGIETHEKTAERNNVTEEEKKTAAKRKAHSGRRKKKKRKKKDTSGNAFLIGSISLAVVAAIVLTILGYRGMKQREAEEFARRYPMRYTELIEQYAGENGIEPAYVAAVILAESAYDPEAVSSVGAQGLMQIMPETGEWLAKKVDVPYVDGCLFDPETNIRFGSWYLGYLMRRYDNDKRCSSAAYHSGQGTVDKWLADPAYSSDGKTLDVIGGSVAPVYVDRVIGNYEVYAGLYEKN